MLHHFAEKGAVWSKDLENALRLSFCLRNGNGRKLDIMFLGGKEGLHDINYNGNFTDKIDTLFQSSVGLVFFLLLLLLKRLFFLLLI